MPCPAFRVHGNPVRGEVDETAEGGLYLCMNGTQPRRIGPALAFESLLAASIIVGSDPTD